MSHMKDSTLEVLIVGGGAAGMAAALVAGRARLPTVIVNAESPRNAVSHASHGFLTRDGAHASELLAIGKAQLTAYPTVEYVHGRVGDVSLDGEGAVVLADDGRRWRTRRVVLATGFAMRREDNKAYVLSNRLLELARPKAGETTPPPSCPNPSCATCTCVPSKPPSTPAP